uniref:Engulfment and cell motility 2 n=1 Tax=Mus musculus TaxID=10090 RepID=D6RHT3_MOUSE
MPPPSDIVKVAIEWPGANAQLLEIDQKRPLASIIKEVCDGPEMTLRTGQSYNWPSPRPGLHAS